MKRITNRDNARQRLNTPDERRLAVSILPDTPSLTDVAAAICTAHAAAEGAARDALARAAEAGRLLLSAKARLPHGDFGPWVHDHCSGIAERTARLYMQIARRWPELEARMQNGNALPLREAQRLLAAPCPRGRPADLVTEVKKMEGFKARLDDEAASWSLADAVAVVHNPLRSAAFRETLAARVRADALADELLEELAARWDIPVAILRTWGTDQWGELAELARARMAELDAAS